MLYLLLVTYGTIFFSELIGDKSIYTISSLTMRFRAFYVFCGFTAAFMIKMLIAVLLGQAIAELPRSVVELTSAMTFLIAALVIWFKKTEDATGGREPEKQVTRAALITFAAILFSEWGDVGQLMAATLTARYRLPLVVWVGATLALVSKGLLALVLGYGLRKRVPVRLLRPLAAGLCLTMAVVTGALPAFKTVERYLH